MGTNYYLYVQPDCECCGRPFERIHIGKGSYGWCFSLHVIPEAGINTLEDWQKIWGRDGTHIRNAEGEAISIKEMEDIITKRAWFSFDSNQSTTESHNLIRHIINDYHCIGHGKGTWDYIIGDFG